MTIQKIFIRSILCLLGSLELALFTSPVAAQVFDDGPSAAILFDTVLNLPPDPNFGFNQSIGGDGLTTQLNFFVGGAIGSSFDANSGSEVNFFSGFPNGGFEANSGSEVNILGGVLGSIDANSGSVVNIFGGVISVAPFDAFAGSDVEIFGMDLAIDGTPLGLAVGDSLLVVQRDVELTGRFASGLPFSFNLNSTVSFPDHFFSPEATLTITEVVPEPSSLTLVGLIGSTMLLGRRRKAYRSPKSATDFN